MADFAATIAQAYAAKGAAVDLGRGVYEGKVVPEAAVKVPLATMNRHGLIAGATGTGKTKTLQGLAEQLSAAGVPVFAADVKGDVSGLAAPGEAGGPAEKRMAELGLKVFTMHDIDRYGMHRVVEEAIEITSTGPFVHISFDMDVVDPDQAPGVGTPVRGGITYREAHLAMELVAKHGILTSLELVEVNPVLDEHNQTASLAVELTCSALGARIL